MALFRLSRGALLASAVALASSVTATGALAADDSQNMPQHLRGTITAVSDSGFTVKSSQDNQQHQVTVNPDTQYAGVTSASLDQIQQDTFIGTANVPGDSDQGARALEMVIFPDAMKGTGLGDYAWDRPRSASMSSNSDKMGGSGSGSTMTNGTVSSTGGDSGKMGGSGSGSTMTNGTVSSTGDDSGKMGGSGSGSTMTNGTVESSDNGSGDMMTLTVDYGDGSKKIRVPSDVPTVKVQKATMEDLEKGQAVFVAGDMSQQPIVARKVIMGLNGTVPPM